MQERHYNKKHFNNMSVFSFKVLLIAIKCFAYNLIDFTQYISTFQILKKYIFNYIVFRSKILNLKVLI